MHIAQLLNKISSISYRAQKWYLHNLYPRVAPENTKIVMEDGTILYLQPRYDYVQREIFIHGGKYCYESHIVQWLDNYLQPGMVVVDVGSHIGYYTGKICKKIHSDGKAYFFEPLPILFDLLSKNLGANHPGCGQALNLAISGRTGEASFFPATDSGRNSLSQNKITNQKKIRVQAVTLDEFAMNNGLDAIDLLMMDVEGAEALVMHGATSLLREQKIKCILCEFHPQQLQVDFKVSPLEFIKSVTDYGYVLFHLDAKTTSEVPFDIDRADQYQHLVFRMKV